METKQLVFIVLTMGIIPSTVWLGITYKWAERGLVAGAFLSTSYLIDINFVSMEMYRGDTRGFEFGSTDWMIISLFLVMLISPRWRRRKITLLPPNSGLAITYFLVALLSALVSYVQVYAGFGLVKIFRGMVVFLVAYNYLNEEEDLRFLITILGSIIVLEFVFVVEQRLTGLYRATGTTPHSNTLAGYLNMINMVFFALLLGDKSRQRMYWVLLAMGSLMVLATFSRGAIVAMLAGYSLVIILSYKDKINARKSRLLLLLAIISVPVFAKVGPALVERFLYAPEESGEGRHLANIAAISMANDHVLGVGLNNYSHVINETEYTRFIDDPVDRGIVHNIYLLHASEMGWGGLLVYVLLMGNFVRLGYRSVGKSENEFIGSVAVGITSAIVVLCLQGSLEWFFRQTYITIEFYMLAGFLVALPKVNLAVRRRYLAECYMRQLLWKQKENPAYQS